MDERQFLDQIDCRFPYLDGARALALVEQACRISPNAVVAVVDELARPPRSAAVPRGTRRRLLEVIAARFDHPLAADMLAVARDMIDGKTLPLAATLTIMRRIALFPDQYAALGMVRMACQEPGDEADVEYQRIVTSWGARHS